MKARKAFFASSTSASSTTARRARYVALNLGIAVLAGVAISGWVLGYTDLFPEVASLLGLGGLFAWIAFVSQVVTEDTKKRLQEGLEARFLARPRFGVALLVVLALFSWWASLRGSLVVSTLHDSRDRTLVVRDRDAKGGWSRVIVDEKALLPRDEKQWSLPTSLWGSHAYQVKVSGLPAAVFEVTAFRHRRVAVPFSFADHPTLLVHTSVAMATTAQSGASTLVVSAADGHEVGRVSPYRGESVWIGCEQDVDIPENILARWRLELFTAAAPPDMLAQWLVRRSIAPEAALTLDGPGTRPLTVELTTPAGQIRAPAPVTPPRTAT